MIDPDKPSAAELRIRREVRAMVWPLAAAVIYATGSVVTTTAWAWAMYGGAALLCLARWQYVRPRLPGEDAPLLATVHEAPWMFALVALSAVTLAIGSVTALLHPDLWWPWPTLAVGVLSTAALIALMVIGRRNYERAKEATT